MNEQNIRGLIEDVREGKLARRDFIGKLAAVGLAAPFAGHLLLNAGIALLNDKKTEEAARWFDQAVARFPAHPDGYYYRGISFLSLGKTAEAKADLEKYVSIAPADAPELATAKKILETIK